MKEKTSRPSLAELGGTPAMECRYCGCRDFRVNSTWRVKDGTIHRQRVCRLCGREVIRTQETPISGNVGCNALQDTQDANTVLREDI